MEVEYQEESKSDHNKFYIIQRALNSFVGKSAQHRAVKISKLFDVIMSQQPL